MQTFTVHLPDASRRDAATLEKAEFVPDGFSYTAFAYGELWLLFQRLWVALALYLAVLALLLAAGVFLNLGAGMLLAVLALMHLFLGLEGNQIRRLSLERSGWPAVEVVTARTLAEAEGKFFAEATRSRPAPAVVGVLPPTLRPGPVLGVFPEPGGRA